MNMYANLGWCKKCPSRGGMEKRWGIWEVDIQEINLGYLLVKKKVSIRGIDELRFLHKSKV